MLKNLSLAMMSLLLLVACDKGAQNATDKPTQATTASATTSETTSGSEYGKNLPAGVPDYKMAVDPSAAPFTLKDEKGTLVGFDIDLIKAIGEKQGFSVTPLASSWNEIFQTLNNNSRDIVGSGVGIIPERLNVMDFSAPYIKSGVSIAYKDPSITNLDSLKGKKIGVQVGASAIEELKKIGFNDENIVSFKTAYLAYQALITGKVDAIAEDESLLKYQKKNLSQLADTSTIKTLPLAGGASADVGFAIKKGRTDLTQKINKGLEQIKADGTYDKIYKKWFGESANSASNTTTASTTK